MTQQPRISAVLIPLLFSLVAFFCYLAIKNQWNFEITTYALFIGTSIYIMIFEKLIPLKRAWKPNKKIIWIDIKHFVFSVAIVDAFAKSLVLILVLYLQENLFSSIEIWNELPVLIVYIIANIVGEFLPYIYHWISHKGDETSFMSMFLWRIHAIHHLPTSLNWFKTNWVHPINMFVNTVLKMLPILVLGFSAEIVFLVGVTHVVVAYSSHANIHTRKSILDYIVVTPQLHHFHHSIKLNEAKNFGNTIPFWDLVFGTYYNRKGAVNKVGVVVQHQQQYPESKDYMKQVKFPISILKDCCK